MDALLDYPLLDWTQVLFACLRYLRVRYHVSGGSGLVAMSLYDIGRDKHVQACIRKRWSTWIKRGRNSESCNYACQFQLWPERIKHPFQTVCTWGSRDKRVLKRVTPIQQCEGDE